jgi:hypothetical protein
MMFVNVFEETKIPPLNESRLRAESLDMSEEDLMIVRTFAPTNDWMAVN